MHVKAHLLHGILEIRASKRQVLQRTDDGAIERRIRGRRAVKCRKLGLRVDRRGGRLAVKHARALEKLMSIPLLMKKEPISASDNLDAEELVQRPHILEGKLIS